MSNESYERLHKLVKFLVDNGMVSRAKIANVIDMSLVDFLQEFEDDFLDYFEKED